MRYLYSDMLNENKIKEQDAKDCVTIYVKMVCARTRACGDLRVKSRTPARYQAQARMGSSGQAQRAALAPWTFYTVSYSKILTIYSFKLFKSNENVDK